MQNFQTFVQTHAQQYQASGQLPAVEVIPDPSPEELERMLHGQALVNPRQTPSAPAQGQQS